jgi:hypothetical protein
MFEIGDFVRVVSNLEVRTIVGIGPGEFFTTQIGNDGATVKTIKAIELQLVEKARRPESGPAFIAPNPFTT